jgi:DNA-binding SARP family transcriptional activator/pimeloyl-ACP methyl ester carboxylesterase
MMLRIHLLGNLTLSHDELPLKITLRPKAVSLLAYLLLNRQSPIPRSRLAFLLWPDYPEVEARANFRRHLHQVRQALPEAPPGQPWLIVDTLAIQWNPEANYWLDVAEFDRLRQEPASLEEAVTLYAGDLLPDCDEEWLWLERESIRESFASLLADLMHQSHQQGATSQALIYGRRLLHLDPLREEVVRQLMVLRYEMGDRAGALQVYQSFAARLEEELGVPPMPGTSSLYEAVLRDEVSREVAGSKSLLALSGRGDAARPMPGTQQIRFCAAWDGLRLAYATSGSGPPLVKAANYLTHLEFDWESPVWRHWLRELSTGNTLVRYDERGCGLSDWATDDFTLEGWVRDLETVVDTLGLERFPLLGISQGGPVAISYAVRHPERVSHLILYGTFLRGRFKRDLTAAQMEEAQTLIQLMKVGWGQNSPAFRQVFTTLFMPEATTEQMHWFNDLQRLSTSPENAVRFETAFYNLDAREVAPLVRVPTLVLHARDDAMIGYEEGRQVAASIPGAQLISLEGKNHILLESEPAWPRFIQEVQRFLGR